MQEEKWYFGQAWATARVANGVGRLEVNGLVDSGALELLHARLSCWLRFRGLRGYVLTLGWRVVLTANGPREIAAFVRGASVEVLAALVVPPERQQWAHRLSAQLAAHGLIRAAFVDDRPAVEWVLMMVAAQGVAPYVSPAPGSAATRPTVRPSSSRRVVPAGWRIQAPMSALSNLRLDEA